MERTNDKAGQATLVMSGTAAEVLAQLRTLAAGFALAPVVQLAPVLQSEPEVDALERLASGAVEAVDATTVAQLRHEPATAVVAVDAATVAQLRHELREADNRRQVAEAEADAFRKAHTDEQTLRLAAQQQLAKVQGQRGEARGEAAQKGGALVRAMVQAAKLRAQLVEARKVAADVSAAGVALAAAVESLRVAGMEHLPDGRLSFASFNARTKMDAAIDLAEKFTASVAQLVTAPAAAPDAGEALDNAVAEGAKVAPCGVSKSDCGSDVDHCPFWQECTAPAEK